MHIFRPLIEFGLLHKLQTNKDNTISYRAEEDKKRFSTKSERLSTLNSDRTSYKSQAPKRVNKRSLLARTSTQIKASKSRGYLFKNKPRADKNVLINYTENPGERKRIKWLSRKADRDSLKFSSKKKRNLEKSAETRKKRPFGSFF